MDVISVCGGEGSGEVLCCKSLVRAVTSISDLLTSGIKRCSADRKIDISFFDTENKRPVALLLGMDDEVEA